MSKMMIIAAVTAIFTGGVKVEDAKDIDKPWSRHGKDCYTKVIEIEGHKYILMDGSYAGSIIHAASCKCMMMNNN